MTDRQALWAAFQKAVADKPRKPAPVPDAEPEEFDTEPLTPKVAARIVELIKAGASVELIAENGDSVFDDALAPGHSGFSDGATFLWFRPIPAPASVDHEGPKFDLNQARARAVTWTTATVDAANNVQLHQPDEGTIRLQPASPQHIQTQEAWTTFLALHVDADTEILLDNELKDI